MDACGSCGKTDAAAAAAWVHTATGAVACSALCALVCGPKDSKAKGRSAPRADTAQEDLVALLHAVPAPPEKGSVEDYVKSWTDSAAAFVNFYDWATLQQNSPADPGVQVLWNGTKGPIREHKKNIQTALLRVQTEAQERERERLAWLHELSDALEEAGRMRVPYVRLDMEGFVVDVDYLGEVDMSSVLEQNEGRMEDLAYWDNAPFAFFVRAYEQRVADLRRELAAKGQLSDTLADVFADVQTNIDLLRAGMVDSTVARLLRLARAIALREANMDDLPIEHRHKAAARFQTALTRIRAVDVNRGNSQDRPLKVPEWVATLDGGDDLDDSHLWNKMLRDEMTLSEELRVVVQGDRQFKPPRDVVDIVMGLNPEDVNPLDPAVDMRAHETVLLNSSTFPLDLVASMRWKIPLRGSRDDDVKMMGLPPGGRFQGHHVLGGLYGWTTLERACGHVASLIGRMHTDAA